MRIGNKGLKNPKKASRKKASISFSWRVRCFPDANVDDDGDGSGIGGSDDDESDAKQ